MEDNEIMASTCLPCGVKRKSDCSLVKKIYFLFGFNFEIIFRRMIPLMKFYSKVLIGSMTWNKKHI
jgi:hypothetical protein